MTRISLKEQYDNSSVIKQLADLTDQIVDYDERITEATETATEAKTAATEAKTTADNAAAKNTEQDAKISDIESVNISQEQEIAGIKLKDAQQDASIAELSQEQDEQDAKIAAIQSKDSEQDAKIALIQAKDTEQDLSISSILDTDTKQDAAIDALKTITNTLTNEVINSVNVVDGTQNGSIMVRLADVGGRVISSPSYPWGQVATFALKQGSEAGYVRGVLTLSDGEVIESNDFQILQIIESDVYVTSITLTPYPTEGKMGGEIGYSNGNTAQMNIIDVPTAPGVTSNINDLLSRMGVAEQSINELDVRVTAIENIPGVGAFTNTSRGTILGSAEDGKVSANEDGTGSVSGWSDVVKSAQISDMLTKTDAAAAYLTKTDAAATYESIEDAEQISVVANEAKSTAEDAQTKANGCFSDADFVDGVLKLKRVDDTQVTVPLSAPSWIGGLYTGEFSEGTISTIGKVYIQYLSYTSLAPSATGGDLIISPRITAFEDKPFFTILASNGPTSYTPSETTHRMMNLSTTAIDDTIHQSLQEFGLSDGEYLVQVTPLSLLRLKANYSYGTNDYYMAISPQTFNSCPAVYPGSIHYTVTDGDLTLTDIHSTITMSSFQSAGVQYIYVTAIARMIE